MMKRRVELEWLDVLPAEDPDARGSRRDLKRLNLLMGHGRVLFDMLQSGTGARTPKRIMELGAGDGTFMLHLARRLSTRWKGVEVVLVDCKKAMSETTRAHFDALGWKVETVASDVFEWLEDPQCRPADIIIANLFLHQFPEHQLSRLLALASERTNLFAACEPRRAPLPLAFSRMVAFIGCNAVTRHDAPLSVKAGFAAREISALWPASVEWRLQERRAHLFSHAFLAERIGYL